MENLHEPGMWRVCTGEGHLKQLINSCRIGWGVCKLDLCGSGWDNCRVDVNTVMNDWGSMKHGAFLDNLRNNELLKKESAPWYSLVC
jgi:hypothetical protein